MAEKELDILCIGNAIVDVFARIDEEVANRHGINDPVQHVEIEKINEILSEIQENLSPSVIISGGGAQKPHARHRACSFDESNTAPPQEELPSTIITSGGGSANVAKIAGILGANVAFTGAIADDSFGRLFEENLTAAGVNVRLPVKHTPTGICLMLQCVNETRIAASPSAALELSESDLSEEDIQKARIVVIDGFMLDRRSFVRRILTLADQCGAVVAIDLSSPFIAREYATEIAGLAGQYSFILFMNENEADAFYCGLKAGLDHLKEDVGFINHADSGFRPFFLSLTKGKSFPIIVVKLGKQGAVCFSGGNSYAAETKEVEPVESTGAGDAFCAAFLTAWARNKTLPECAVLGNKAARIILDVTGTLVDRKAFECLSDVNAVM